MECLNCSNCRFPRSENDNNGNCKCKIMKNKTIDVYVCGGETPEWCPLNNKEETALFKIFEVDYTQKSFPVGESGSLTEAKRMANKAYKKSHGEFPVFISDGTKVVWNKK